MEHRCTERYCCNLSVIISKQGQVVAVGRIKNGSHLGVFVEADLTDIECGQQLSLKISTQKFNAGKSQSLSMRALVIHKTRQGFGAVLDIATQRQIDILKYCYAPQITYIASSKSLRKPTMIRRFS